MDLVGKVLGNRYEIIKKIGVGGMATVYKARCNVLNRYVAIKVLREEYITDSEFIKRFNSEAQAAGSLAHQNIVSIYDVANEDNVYYIVMELIMGKTLKEIIDTDGVLSWKWSANIAIQIAKALEVAHKNNVIHRDIKPHNIIITEEGVAKVTDFGIARAVSNATITAFGSTMGSVHYFSPEHAKGGYTDAKSDIYSLGVVLYEMLTGKVPFDADTPVSIALKHMQEEPIEPMKLNVKIPKPLNDIIMRAMKKEPNERYMIASEMISDLNEVLKNPETDVVKMVENSDYAKTQRISTAEIEQRANQSRRAKQQENKSFFEKNKFIKFGLIIIALIAIFMGSIFAGYNIIKASKPKEVAIPNLVGLTQDEAQSQLLELNLKYIVTEEKYDDETEAGVIMQQTPKFAENFMVLEESTVEVVVSKGKEIVIVPKIVGEKLETAIAMLEEKGLEVKFIEQNDEKVEQGYVISQEPAADVEVAGKSVVTIYVSKGINMVTVPDVLGKTEKDARKLIEEAGLTLVAVVSEEDTTKEDNVIIKQTLQAGDQVEEKTEITLTLNSLPQLKTGTVSADVDSFTGFSAELAKWKEENANIVVEEGETAPVAPTPENVEVTIKVTSQGVEETIYKKDIPENTTNITATFQGVGTVTIKLYVAGVLEKQEMLNLNQEDPKLVISGEYR